MASIIINNFIKGIAPYTSPFNGANINFGDYSFMGGQTRGINPFRFLNCLAPAAGATTATNASAITDFPKVMAVRNISTGEAYILGSGDNASAGSSKLYKVTGSNFDTITNAGSFPHAITNSKNGHDLRIVVINGTEYLLYTWDDGDSASPGPHRYVGLWDFSSAWTSANAAKDDWFQLSSSGGADQYGGWPVPMEQGADGNIYIGNGYILDEISTTVAIAGSQVTSQLIIPRNYVITSIKDYKGTLVIAASPKQSLTNPSLNGQSKVFFWSYSGSTFDSTLTIEDNKIGSLYVKDGVLYAFTGTREGYSKLRYFTGQSFETLTEFLGNPPLHNTPDSYKDMIMWVANSSVHTYGSPHPSFAKSYNIIHPTNTAISFAKPLISDYQNFYQYHLAGSGMFSKISGLGTGIGDGSNTCIYYTNNITLPHNSNIKGFRVRYLPLASGATATFKYAVNSSGSFSALTRDSGVISYALDGTLNPSWKYFPQTLNNVNNIQLSVEYTAGGAACVAITQIEIDYVTTNKQ